MGFPFLHVRHRNGFMGLIPIVPGSFPEFRKRGVTGEGDFAERSESACAKGSINTPSEQVQRRLNRPGRFLITQRAQSCIALANLDRLERLERFELLERLERASVFVRNSAQIDKSFMADPGHQSTDSGLTSVIDSEGARLKMNIPALTAGNTQNLLTLRTYDNCRFRSATTTKATDRSSRDDVLTEGNEKLDLFRWCEIGNWHGTDENPNGASRTHETTVTLDDEAPRVPCLREQLRC